MNNGNTISHQPLQAIRNYSLDLLRILCMLMIVCLHCLCYGYGNLLNIPATGIDIPTTGVWFEYSFTRFAVNTYVLISGYFLVKQEFRFSRVIKLLCQIWFYSWGITLALVLTGRMKLSLGLGSDLLPLTTDGYWFLTNYIGLCLLSPFLNMFIHKLSKKQHIAVICLLVVMIGLWRDILPVVNSPFYDNTEYSMILFVTMYLIAAFIRLHVDIQKIKHPFLLCVGSCVFMTGAWAVLRLIYEKGIDISQYFAWDHYYYNHSVPTIMGAVGLFLTFLKCKVNNRWLIRFIQIVSPLTVGVYLIHENYNLRMRLWGLVERITGSLPRNALLPLKTILVAIAVFAICCCIDFVRAKGFALIERSNWYKRSMEKLNRIPQQLQDVLAKWFSRVCKD